MYFIILPSDTKSISRPPNDQYVSFAETNIDVCYGDQVPQAIKGFTVLQYLEQCGNRVIKSVRRNETTGQLHPTFCTIQDEVASWNPGVKQYFDGLEAAAERSFFKSHPELNP
jgi:hypothetical protein